MNEKSRGPNVATKIKSTFFLSGKYTYNILGIFFCKKTKHSYSNKSYFIFFIEI